MINKQEQQGTHLICEFRYQLMYIVTWLDLGRRCVLVDFLSARLGPPRFQLVYANKYVNG